VSLGGALYPPAEDETPGMLLNRARSRRRTRMNRGSSGELQDGCRLQVGLGAHLAHGL
jgi:hypothetical protein